MALTLSLRHGGGDLDWFRKLPRTRQAEVIALHDLESEERR